MSESMTRNVTYNFNLLNALIIIFGFNYLVIWISVILLRFFRHWQGTISGYFDVKSSHEFFSVTLDLYSRFLVYFSSSVFFLRSSTPWRRPSFIAAFLCLHLCTNMPLLLSFYFTILLSASLSLPLNRQITNVFNYTFSHVLIRSIILLRRNLQTF